MTNTAAVISLALQHHQAGNLSQAEPLYRQVLLAEPQNVDALYLLALLCQAQGRVAESVPLYQQVLRIRPDLAEVHSSLGGAHASQGRLAEAIACYQEAVRLKPDYADAFNNLGFLQTSRGDLDEAMTSLRKALALKPDYPEALSNLGIVHFQKQQVDEAARCFREALALSPQYPEALNNLGNALLAQGKVTEAGDCYRQALQLRPHDARAYNNLAGVYRTQHQYEEAVACLRESLAHNPNDAITHRNLGKMFYDQRNYAEALPCFQHVLTLCPDDADARLFVEALGGASSLARVPADFLATMYDQDADRFEPDLVQPRNYRSPELLKAALEPAPAARSLAMLDLGCGTGLCGVQFRDWAKTLIGVDLSANMLTRARDKGIYDQLIQSDLLPAVQAYEEQFDLVVASDVLLYFGDLGPLTQAVRRALRPGGRFAFNVDLLEEVDTDYRLLPVIHFAHSRAYLQNLAARAQLEIGLTPALFPRATGEEVAGLVVVLSRPKT